MPEEDFHFEDKKAESFDSSTNAAEGRFLEDSRLNLIEKSRRGRFAEANERRARAMLWLAIGFFVAVSLPYLVVLYLAVGGLLSPNALDVSVSLKRIIRILDFPIYIVVLPFAVSVAFGFLAGFQSGMRGKGSIGPVGLDTGAEGG